VPESACWAVHNVKAADTSDNEMADWTLFRVSSDPTLTIIDLNPLLLRVTPSSDAAEEDRLFTAETSPAMTRLLDLVWDTLDSEGIRWRQRGRTVICIADEREIVLRSRGSYARATRPPLPVGPGLDSTFIRPLRYATHTLQPITTVNEADLVQARSR